MVKTNLEKNDSKQNQKHSKLLLPETASCSVSSSILFLGLAVLDLVFCDCPVSQESSSNTTDLLTV